MTHVDFPIGGVCSVVILLQDGRQVEAGMVGNEEMIAGMLQRAGCIRYQRGAVRILQREELERGSCECHEVV